MTTSLASSVSDLLSPVLADEGIELVDVEYQVDTQTLKLLIHKPGGINIEDCQQVSRIANPILDVHDMILGTYNLEVASPGLNRPLITEADFRRNLGRKAQVEVSTTTENWSQFNGTLNQVSDGKIFLTLSSGKTVQIAISDVVQAQIQLMW
jgi:ribosome maturation factor RimP